MTLEERRQLEIQDNQLAILSGAVTSFPKFSSVIMSKARFILSHPNLLQTIP